MGRNQIILAQIIPANIQNLLLFPVNFASQAHWPDLAGPHPKTRPDVLTGPGLSLKDLDCHKDEGATWQSRDKACLVSTALSLQQAGMTFDL